MKKLLLFAFITCNLFAQNYIFSISQKDINGFSTLCVGNPITTNGAIDMQMRCYDSTNPKSFRMILNTTIYDSTLIDVFPWTIPGQPPPQPWIGCVFSRLTTDSSGNILPSTTAYAKSMAIRCINLVDDTPILNMIVFPGGFVTNKLAAIYFKQNLSDVPWMQDLWPPQSTGIVCTYDPFISSYTPNILTISLTIAAKECFSPLGQTAWLQDPQNLNYYNQLP